MNPHFAPEFVRFHPLFLVRMHTLPPASVHLSPFSAP